MVAFIDIPPDDLETEERDLRKRGSGPHGGVHVHGKATGYFPKEGCWPVN